MRPRPLAVALLISVFALVLAPQQPPAASQKKGFTPPIVPRPEELALVKSRAAEIDALLAGVKTDPDHRADVAVFSKAGHFLHEFPQTFFTQEGIDQSLAVLDQGLERARQLRAGQTPWLTGSGRKILGYVSPLDGSVQPMGVTIPPSYDGSRPVRLYVWLHGRDQLLSEARFIARFPAIPASLQYRTADLGQITLDAYGRWNNANHWAGEVDIFEAIAAVQRRYKIDPDRIILRGFSLGGAGAWHVALHHPGFFAAAEIGAGTYPRRASLPGFPPYQAATLRIWENIVDWALNAHNIPIAAHDGDSDPGTAAIPPLPAGTPHRGQLESSLRVRAQLEKEGFVSEGTPHFLRVKGTSSICLISANTGHAVSPLVREQLDAFLKEHGDRGRVSPDHIRFLTYTTRYHNSHWITVKGLKQHYERAEVDATRDAARRTFRVKTRNVSLLRIAEADSAADVEIDGVRVPVKAAPALLFAKTGASGAWRSLGELPKGLTKHHALQGPIDDAFLDPFLLVRPTGKPWNEAAHQQALRILARFDRVYARWYRAHPRIKDDRDVTPADLEKYNVALFGDPGSNRWIARLHARLPLAWSKSFVKVGAESFAAATHLPAFLYPNPLAPQRYIVVNSGLTIDEREYQSDYSMPRLGDFAVLKVGDSETPEAVKAGLFDESWRLPR